MSCYFLDGLKQNVLKIKPKNLLATPCQPWLVPSGITQLLVVVVL